MIYESCGQCSGRGSFNCSCACSTCSGKRTIQSVCSNCNAQGSKRCNQCSGSGRVLISKSWLFGEKYGSCSRCRGAGVLECRDCQLGYVQRSCNFCRGTGASSTCQRCQGKGTIPCSSCEGHGRLRPQWSKERIRVEIEERQDEERQLKEAIDYWYEEYNNNPAIYDQGFPARDQESRLAEIRGEISELRSWLY